MRRITAVSILVLAWTTAGAPFAQTAPEPPIDAASREEAPAPADALAPCPPAERTVAQAAPPEPESDQPGMAEDVGSAVGGTVGYGAGAAVGGPVGGAVASVLLGKVGEGIAGVAKKIVKREPKPDPLGDAAAARDGAVEASLACDTASLNDEPLNDEPPAPATEIDDAPLQPVEPR